MADPTPGRRDLIRGLYEAYNAQDLNALSALIQEDVDWPDDARRLHGRAAVRDYWSRQWTRIRTHDAVVGIAVPGRDRAKVRIDQVVRDLDGAVLSRGSFEHSFEFRDGLVVRMDIRRLRPPERSRNDEMTENEAMVRRLYEGFNRRDIPAVLARLHPEVDWANGLEGGHVHGPEAVRAYWTRQWASIQARVDPLRIEQRDDGALAIDVRQVVHDLEGKLLLDEQVRHVFRIEDGLVTRFDVENAGGLSALARS